MWFSSSASKIRTGHISMVVPAWMSDVANTPRPEKIFSISFEASLKSMANSGTFRSMQRNRKICIPFKFYLIEIVMDHFFLAVTQ